MTSKIKFHKIYWVYYRWEEWGTCDCPHAMKWQYLQTPYEGFETNAPRPCGGENH